ncbi:MAG: hypothetical protein ACON4N_11820 [Myxococcota bacterium]
MSGPKDSKTDARSALADFFGDDDMWDDEEDAEGDAPPAQEPAEAAEADDAKANADAGERGAGATIVPPPPPVFEGDVRSIDAAPEGFHLDDLPARTEQPAPSTVATVLDPGEVAGSEASDPDQLWSDLEQQGQDAETTSAESSSPAPMLMGGLGGHSALGELPDETASTGAVGDATLAETAESSEPAAAVERTQLVLAAPATADERSAQHLAMTLARIEGTHGSVEAQRWAEAGHVALHRVGDAARALTYLRSAADGGCRDPQLIRDRVLATRSEAPNTAEAGRACEDLADMMTGAAATDLALEAARNFHAAGDMDAALRLTRRALGAEPHLLAAWELLGAIGATSGDAALQREALDGTATHTDPALVPPMTVARALLQHASGDTTEALASLAELVTPAARRATRDILTDVGDASRLAAFYGERAAAAEDTASAAFWWLEASHHWMRHGDEDQCREAETQALATTDPYVELHVLSRAMRAKQWSLVRELLDTWAERDGDASMGRAWAFASGAVSEWCLEDHEAAVQAYNKAAGDGGFEAATRGVERLVRTGDPAGYLSFLQARLETISDDEARGEVLYTMAEFASSHASMQEEAVACWRQLTAHAETDRCAWLGLLGAAVRAGDADARAHAVQGLTGVGVDAADAALLSALCEAPAASIAAACRQALAARPGDALASMGAWVVAPWEATSEDTALVATDVATAECVYLGVYWAATAGRWSEAVACVHEREVTARTQALLEHGESQEGITAAVDAAVDALVEDASMEQAAAAAWLQMLDGRPLPLDAEDIADVPMLHRMGVLAMLNVGDQPALTRWALTDSLSTVQQLVGLGAMAPESVEDARQLLTDLVEASELPPVACEDAAVQLMAWEELDLMLTRWNRSDVAQERAELALERLGDAERALACLEDGQDGETDDLVHAVWASKIATRLGRTDAAVANHLRAADMSECEGFKAHHLSLAVGLMAIDDPQLQVTTQTLMSLRPGAEIAFYAALRTLCSSGADAADAVEELFVEHRTEDTRGRGYAMAQCGAYGRAADVWEECAEQSDWVSDTLMLEVALSAAERWETYYAVLEARASSTEDGEARSALDAELRWLLANPLAGTDIAWDRYRELHRAHPEDASVLDALAGIASARGDVGAAVEYVSKLREMATTPTEVSQASRRLAQIHREAGDDAAARTALMAVLESDGQDADALHQLRELAGSAEDWSSVLDVLNRNVGMTEGEARADLLREVATLTEEHLNDPGRAIESWRAVLAQAPGDVPALQSLVSLCRAHGDKESFLEVAAQLVNAAPEDRGAVLLQMGEVCDELGRMEDALQHFEQAMTHKAQQREAAAHLERMFRARGDWAGVVRTLRVQAEAMEDSEQRLTKLREVAEVQKTRLQDVEGTFETLQSIIELVPDDVDALRYAVAHLYGQDRFAEAMPLAERLEPLVLQDEDLDDFDVQLEAGEFLYRFADMLCRSDRLAEARERYEKVLEFNPTHLPSLQALGPLLMEREQWTEAEAVFRRLLQLTGGQGEPDSVASLYANLGHVELALDRPGKAERRFAKALAANPNHIGALKGKARLLFAEEKWSELLEVYNNVVYHATSHADITAAYLVKAHVLDQKLDRIDKAIQHVERSLAFDPNQPTARLLLMELLLRAGKFDQVVSLAERAAAAVEQPHLGAVQLTVTLARLGMGERHEAEEALQRGRAHLEGGDQLSVDEPEVLEARLRDLVSGLQP